MNPARQHYLEGFLASRGKSRRDAGLVAVTRAAPPPSTPAEQDTSGDLAPQSEPAAPASFSWEEQVKRDLLPFDAFPRLRSCASADEPPSAADRFRFQWFGLFYLGPEKDACVVRLRLPGGRLQGFQLLGLAEIVQELAAGVVELNSQGGLDLPGVPLRAGVEVLRRVEGIGLNPRGTGGDCVQAVRGGEREGCSPAEWPLVYGLVCELEQALAQNREFGDLPGPCEIVFRPADAGWPADDGSAASDAGRLTFQASRPVSPGALKPEGWPNAVATDTPDWQVRLPGSGELGVAIATADVLPVCLTLLRIWSRRASRTTREQAALASFCAQLGVGNLRAALEQEFGKRFPPSAPSEASASPTGLAAPLLVPGGRLLSGQMVALARLAARYGLDELRFVQPGGLLVPGGTEAAGFEAIFYRTAAPEMPA